MSKPRVLPRVVIDARMVAGKPHGFARYVTRLADGLEALAQAGPLPYEFVFLTAPGNEEDVFKYVPKCEVAIPFLAPSEIFQLPRIVRGLGASLYHSPTFSSPVGLPCPWVSTVHDLNHLHYGSMAEKLYYRARLRPFARKARALVTVSEFSRAELAAWLPCAEAAIEIAPNALDPALGETVPESEIDAALALRGLRRGRYFLCISSGKPHKNVNRLVEAHRALGQGAWPLVLNFGGHEGVIAIDDLGDRDAQALLQGAGLVLFPSLYEGFGLPALEAAVSGAPLAVSKIPPHLEGLRELAPGEATWVEPLDIAGWTAALREAQRGALAAPSAEGRAKLLKTYGVDRLVSRMDQIYRRVLGI